MCVCVYLSMCISERDKLCQRVFSLVILTPLCKVWFIRLSLRRFELCWMPWYEKILGVEQAYNAILSHNGR